MTDEKEEPSYQIPQAVACWAVSYPPRLDDLMVAIQTALQLDQLLEVILKKKIHGVLIACRYIRQIYRSYEVGELGSNRSRLSPPVS